MSLEFSNLSKNYTKLAARVKKCVILCYCYIITNDIALRESKNVESSSREKTLPSQRFTLLASLGRLGFNYTHV